MKYLIFASILIGTFLMTVIVLSKLIPFMMSKKLGQKILDIGPRWHKGKEGTPTMGGLAFILASVVFGIVAFIGFGFNLGFSKMMPFLVTLIYALLCGGIGFLDDSIKLHKKSNDGLKSWQKLVFQVITSVLFLVFLRILDATITQVYIPFYGDFVDFGIWYYIVALIVLVGMNNAVNVTDGVDGLCGGITLIIGIFYSIYAFIYHGGIFNASLGIIGAIIVGGALGFLVYNFHPAKVFMGDTGSLFFGALLTGTAFMIKQPIIIIVVGLVYVIEIICDLIQIVSIKLFFKKVFPIAPIHHSFEKIGWSEIKICVVAVSITAVMSALALLFIVF